MRDETDDGTEGTFVGRGKVLLADSDSQRGQSTWNGDDHGTSSTRAHRRLLFALLRVLLCSSVYLLLELLVDVQVSDLVHVLSLVIPAINEHALRVQPWQNEVRAWITLRSA